MLQLTDEQLTDLAVTLIRCHLLRDRRAVRALVRTVGAELIQDAGDE